MSTKLNMQYCIPGTCTYFSSIAPRIYLPPGHRLHASLPVCRVLQPLVVHAYILLQRCVAWPLDLIRRHPKPVMTSCVRTYYVNSGHGQAHSEGCLVLIRR